MRVGFDVTPLSLPRSGIGTYTQNLFDHLRDQVELVPLAQRQFNKTLWMQGVLPLQAWSHRLSLAHFTNNVGAVMMPCPTVITLHDMTLWKFPQFHYARRLIAMRPFIPMAARRAAAVITVSHSAKQDIVETLAIPASKIHVIYEAASASFVPITTEEARARIAYPLPEKFIVYVGTLEPRKNLTGLLKAFAALHQAGAIPHHLFLIGSMGWKTEDIFDTINTYHLDSLVHYAGYVPQAELVALLNLADAMIFPSFYEGFGLPVIEAMACGTPVITTSCGALGEIAGDAAEFVTPEDIDSIAHGLNRVLNDTQHRQRLRAAGLINARRFSWQKAAEQTLSVYRQVLA